MKPKHIFWGFLFITIGVLILLNNIGSLYINLDYYWKYWPLVLVLLGVSFLLSNKWIRSLFAAVSGIILAVALFSFFSYTFAFINNRFVINDNGVHFEADNSDLDTNYYSEPFSDSIKSAEFDFEAGAGTFRITDSTSKLFEAVTRGLPDNYDLSTYESDGKKIVKFGMLKKKIILNDGDHGNQADIRLNTIPVWDMVLKVGAASMNFDLSRYAVNNIRLKTGAAKVKIRLGDKSPETNLRVDAGVSSLDIEVPESAGCRIHEDISLSSKHFNGFKKISSGYYTTGNFDSAKSKIYINLKSGISSVNVNRYSPGW